VALKTKDLHRRLADAAENVGRSLNAERSIGYRLENTFRIALSCESFESNYFSWQVEKRAS
jgi:hypothetical protein